MPLGDKAEMQRRIPITLTVEDWLRIEALVIVAEFRLEEDAPKEHRLTMARTRLRLVTAIKKARRSPS